jgi:hypothetical protein
MKAGPVLRTGGPVARSLGVGGPTRAAVLAFSAAISLNGALAAEGAGPAGQAAAVAAVFASVAVCSAAVSLDVLKRSARAVADLRSLGATRRAIASALFWSVFVYGAAGSVAGGAAGALAGSALDGGGRALVALAVVLASAGGAALGSYAGGRGAWRS